MFGCFIGFIITRYHKCKLLYVFFCCLTFWCWLTQLELMIGCVTSFYQCTLDVCNTGLHDSRHTHIRLCCDPVSTNRQRQLTNQVFQRTVPGTPSAKPQCFPARTCEIRTWWKCVSIHSQFKPSCLFLIILITSCSWVAKHQKRRAESARNVRAEIQVVNSKSGSPVNSRSQKRSILSHHLVGKSGDYTGFMMLNWYNHNIFVWAVDYLYCNLMYNLTYMYNLYVITYGPQRWCPVYESSILVERLAAMVVPCLGSRNFRFVFWVQ